MPHGVEAVVVFLAFGGDAVHLNSIRVRKEHVGAAAIVEGVEADAHCLVAGDLIAPGESRSKRFRVSFAFECNVEIDAVVGKVGGGFAGCRLSVLGLTLAEIGNAGLTLAGSGGQKLRDLRGSLDPRDPDGGRRVRGCDGLAGNCSKTTDQDEQERKAP